MACEVHEVELTAIRPAIEGTVRRRFGSVEVDLTDDGHAIVGTVVPMTVDPVKLQLDRAAGEIVSVEVLAPFPVRVDKATNQILPDVIPVPPDAWPLVAGLRVREGVVDAVIVSVDGARVTLKDPSCVPTAPTRASRGAWAGVATLVLAGAVLLGVLVARRMG